jgi:type I restriction enzyme S subunit
MREMKDSRIEWIGQIPSTWRINKGKYFISLLNKPARETDEIITCFRDGEVTLRSNRREDGFTVSLTETGYQGIDVGDLIVHGMDGFAGAIGISDSRGKATPVLNVLNTTECKKYIMYLMRSMAYCGLFLSLSTGIRVRTCDTNWKKLREIDYLLPDLLEQQNIANFLDAKCAEIDALAADIQTQIDTLEQYKRSVITEAITKGLNPDVEMACHQISWIEQMPAHWKIIPSKYLFHNSDKRKCEGDQQLTASQKHGIITQQEYMERENSKIVFANQGLENWKHVEPYDFVISLRSFQGGLEMSETTGCITWHYVVLKANKPICPRFYKWLFKSSAYINALQGTCNFIRDGQDLRFSNFAQVPLYEPPLSEQEDIASYLDMKCSQINSISDQKKEQLTVLEAYKKSLIYEYVTGKKEVPVQ